MKPYKNFLFFSSVLLLLAGVVFFFGGENYPIGEYARVRIPRFDEMGRTAGTPEEPRVFVMTEEEKAAFLAVDSSMLTFPELLDLPFYPFEYGDAATHPLAAFFDYLSTMTDTCELVRILHYGDSQIEGDRISSTIRHYMQQSFGGGGMGAVPLFSPVNVSSYVVEKSMSWRRQYVTDREPSNALGATMGYLHTATRDAANVRLRVSPYILYPDAAPFSTINILTLNTQNTENIEVSDRAGTQFRIQNQRIGEYFSLMSFPFDTAQRRSEIIFRNSGNTHLHSISLDSRYGITVDNMPIRGAAGYIFSRQKANLLQESFLLLNAKLVLLQFGVNLVPNDAGRTVNASSIENALARELSFLKASMPDVSVVVISVSDRAYKDGERYRTNPNVPLVRNAQRNAALRAGYAFWDLYEAMGGENSMAGWVNQRPALGGRDYTHFSARGAQRVGEMFYKSLMIEYVTYLKQQKEYALQQKLQALNEPH